MLPQLEHLFESIFAVGDLDLVPLRHVHQRPLDAREVLGDAHHAAIRQILLGGRVIANQRRRDVPPAVGEVGRVVFLEALAVQRFDQVRLVRAVVLQHHAHVLRLQRAHVRVVDGDLRVGVAVWFAGERVVLRVAGEVEVTVLRRQHHKVPSPELVRRRSLDQGDVALVDGVLLLEGGVEPLQTVARHLPEVALGVLLVHVLLHHLLVIVVDVLAVAFQVRVLIVFPLGILGHPAEEVVVPRVSAHLHLFFQSINHFPLFNFVTSELVRKPRNIQVWICAV
mmetsp:Transcript_70776/g.188938  ORF Transcript_70776/g.188938 Transcript_70776/m.188938 type:complete len:281 (+) Transcript_70776:1133-1975(+)